MHAKRDLTTPNERIGWVLEQQKAAGHGLVELAGRMGCTHAALSQWQNGATNIENVKVGLLSAFSRETGVSMHWILTGEGPRVDVYASSEHVAHLTTVLNAMERQDPKALGVVARMIEAAAPEPQH